ncbi:uncharacterized protein LOC143904324 isoform X2 [Temnothorax americanus]|uniref:uncharacterized protein LOC143904324 isoform X2 n=1 Tax=Temnothorax americanus TaxID=1964332 RepID=UPI004067BC9D
MVRCIVKNCENNCRTCTPEQANFHKLPDNKIIREGWFRSIGEVILPSNIVNARICSVHFTPESFIQSKRKRGENIFKRRLLPTAVPTLHLVTTNEQAHDKGNINCNIVKRTFNLVCPSTSPLEAINAASLSPVPDPSKERISSVEPELSSLLGSSTPVSRMMTEPLLDLGLLDKADMTGQHETPTTSVSCRNPWLEPNGRVNRTPEGPFDSLCNVRNSTFPTRCERKKAVLHRRSELSAVRQLKYGKTRLTSKITGKEENEYFSEEGSQRLKRQHRFVDDNCTGSSRDNTTRKEEDPYETNKWMKNELNHYRTLGKFHKNSSENHFQEQNFVQANNVALKLELTEREQQLKAILAENLTLKKSIADLHVRLETTNLEKETALTVGVTEKVKTSISPKAYRYFRLKLHFPLPSLASLRRWALKKFDVYEGFLMDVLAIMKQKSADLSEMMKITVLTFDEMAVSDEVRFDSKLQKLIGPCSKVQVIMLLHAHRTWGTREYGEN